MSKKKESYFSTIKQSEWGGIDDKMKEIVFHKYFLGDVKNRYGIDGMMIIRILKGYMILLVKESLMNMEM